MTRSGIFWESTDLVKLDLPEMKWEEFLPKLPTCVKKLRIGNCSCSHFKRLNVPILYHVLFERFPDLKVLIIEKAILQHPFIQLSGRNGYMLNCLIPIEQQIPRYFSVVVMEKNRNVVDFDFNNLVTLLRHITVLSLRNSILAVECRDDKIQPLVSEIKVLDLTNCPCAVVQTIRQFVQLPLLEELYLAGTAININAVQIIMSEVPNLKVIDLDDTIVGGETFTVLRDRGRNLVAIYLGKTAVKDSDMIGVDEETFPVLRKICLQRTAVSEIGVHNLLFAVPSLTHIFLTKSRVKITWILDQPTHKREKLKYDDSDESEVCNHFLKDKFGGKFSSCHN